MKELNAILTIAARDFTKLLRDRPRLIISFIFPVIFIGALGGGLQANLGKQIGYNFLTFTFTGVFAQVLFQSTASGIISLIEDRTNDFSQEIFVSPTSRYSIILGKIIGETLVAFTQVFGVVIFGMIVGVPLGFLEILKLIPVGLAAALFGGAFGTIVMANLGNIRSANQIFPFLIFPQFFLSGVFNPIKESPPMLAILSKITPMTYPVDLVRGIYYAGTPEYSKVVLHPPLINLTIMILLFLIMLILGTFLFVRNERNR